MDLNAIKQRLNALQQKPNQKNSTDERKKFMWKPSVGKQTIRIVPSKFDKQNPFKEIYFHYGIGNRTILSPTNFGEKDPIIEFAKQLRQTQDKENWKLAKKLDPKMRVFVPIIVRGEEHLGTRLWEFGKELYMEFLSLADDEDIGDYTDILEGRDITVDTVGPESTGTKYNKSSIRVKTKQSVLTDDKNLLKKLLEDQPEPSSLYTKYDFDTIKKMLQEWLTPDEESSELKEEETNDEETTVTAPVSKSEPSVKQSKSANFDSLFSEDNDDDDLPF
jgi:hypothetical protein